MKTVAIIPAYNEEGSIAGVVKGAKKYVDKVLVLNDGSTDKTEMKAKKAGAAVFSNTTNRGLCFTILVGYREALRMGADVVLQMDGDGQHITSDIPKVLEPVVKKKADMTLGIRSYAEAPEMLKTKRFGNRMFSRITSFLAGMKITDAQTGFRATSRELLENIIPTGKYTYTQEMIIRASREGYRIIEIPITVIKRRHGSSRLISSSLSYGKNVMPIMIKTFREYNPLAFFGLPGAALMLSGFVVAGYLLNIYLSTGAFEGRIGVITLATFLIISGGLLIFMGMLADMMEAKYRQIREHFRRAHFRR
jgi:glycosyltransferase involved in cell wall biosynthesis